jgi:hypothetical protein
MRFKPHTPKQEAVLTSKKRISIAATGIQWGKTTIGVVRLMSDIYRYTSPEDNFIVTSPTYKVLYQSTLPPFLRYTEGLGRYNKQNECFKIHGGGTVWFRTGQNPDSVVGITQVRHILCDEAGLYTSYFKDNIFARSSIRQCPITIVTSPYSLNWLWTDFIRKHRNDDPYIKEMVHLCQANSAENPYFPKEEYHDRQKTMDPRRFNMVYGGVFDRAVGLEYDCFDVGRNIVEPFSLPMGTRYFGAIDWGYTHPTVIKVRAITEDGMHYSIYELARTQMRIGDIIDALTRINQMWPVEKYFCDCSRPEHIEELNKNGLRAQSATNDIIPGIEKHYELIKEGNYAVFSGTSKITIDEYETYHYPDPADLRPDQNDRRDSHLPVDQNNHAMDAERYLTMGTWRIGRFKNRVVSEEKSVIPSKLVSTYDLGRDKLLRKRRNADLPL